MAMKRGNETSLDRIEEEEVEQLNQQFREEDISVVNQNQ
jgi:hypothetical protein